MEDSLTDYGGSIGQNMDAVELGDMEENAREQQRTTQQERKVKVPRRIIHFVSGETMEEYSTDEEEEEDLEQPEIKAPPPKNVGPYVWFHLSKAAYSTLSACDYLGEKFADLLGISSAKYQYAIDQHDRQKKEEEERKKKEGQLPEESERYVIDQLRSEEYWEERITIPDVSDGPAAHGDLTCDIASEEQLPPVTFGSPATVTTT